MARRSVMTVTPFKSVNAAIALLCAMTTPSRICIHWAVKNRTEACIRSRVSGLTVRSPPLPSISKPVTASLASMATVARRAGMMPLSVKAEVPVGVEVTVVVRERMASISINASSTCSTRGRCGPAVASRNARPMSIATSSSSSSSLSPLLFGCSSSIFMSTSVSLFAIA